MRTRNSARLADIVAAVGAVVVLASGVSAQTLTVSVTIGNNTTTIGSAKVEIDSSRGYMLGHSFQDFGGFHVTDAVVPPDGVELRPSLVKWDAIKEVEFLDWNVKAGTKSFTKAKLTTADGSTREVFLWNLGNRDEDSQLDAYEVQIVGKLSIAGKDQDVQIKERRPGSRSSSSPRQPNRRLQPTAPRKRKRRG